MSWIVPCYLTCGLVFVTIAMAFGLYEGRHERIEETSLPIPVIVIVLIFALASVIATWPLWWISNIIKGVRND